MVEPVTGLRDAVATGSALRVADELVRCFEHVAGRPDKLQWTARHVEAQLDGPLDPALQRACAAVAAAIDAQPAAYDRLGYHNRQHFCEVALTACSLCLVNRLDAPSAQLVLLAALVHDAVHEGQARPAFVQERASVDSMRPRLLAAGLDAARIGRLMAMVLSTDIVAGTACMAAACRAHAAGTDLSLPVPDGAPELALLAQDPTLARLAGLLCEADVLPSIGLDAGHALRVQQRLAREWDRELDSRDKLAFIDGVLHQGYIGGFFLPCVHATRAALVDRPHAAVPH